MNVTTTPPRSAQGPRAATAPTAHEEKEGFDESGSLLSSADGDQRIGSYAFTGKWPGLSGDLGKGTGQASIGELSGDVTVARTHEEGDIGNVGGIGATATALTANAHVSGGAEGSLKKGHVRGSAGAEAMLFDVKAEGTVNVTPKTVTDLLSGAYNEIVDPVVDRLAGRDVPGLPEAPESWDHGLVLNGYAEGGVGASLKAHAGIEVGGGAGFKASAGFKAGLGPVQGFGGSIGFK